MADRLLTYLLTILLPLSPLLCGQCQRSAIVGSNALACCGDRCSSQTGAANSDRTFSGNCLESSCCHQPTADHTDIRREPTPSPPCRHEHCRSAICGQSAILVRPNGNLDPDGPQTPSLAIPVLHELAAQLAWHDCEIAALHRPSGGRVNVGPSGRAARVQYVSWLI